MLSEKQYDYEEQLPFSFKPKQKISLTDLYEVLRDHNEGTKYDKSKNYTNGDPHTKAKGICANTTQYGFVAQLRSDLPPDIGYVMWLSPFRPCVHPFTPWYFGMVTMPENFNMGNYNTALETHFNKIENIKMYAPDHHFHQFPEYAKKIDKDYGDLITDVSKSVSEFESNLLFHQDKFEKDVLDVYKNSPDSARQMLTDYSTQQINEILNMIKD